MELNEKNFDDIQLLKWGIRWMMQQVSVLIRLRECYEDHTLEDNEFQKKLCKENQIVTLNSKESFFPKKVSNSVFRE